MELTQQDFDARVERAHAGVATDDDLRLIKQYQAEGFEQSDKSLTPAEKQNPPVKDESDGDYDAATDKPGSEGGNADDGQDKPSVAERRTAGGDDPAEVTAGFPTGGAKNAGKSSSRSTGGR